MSESFHLPLRVYIEDTDVGGVVYYANYLKFLERARTELFRSKGYQLRSSFESDVSYVVHSINIKYMASAKLDDLLKVYVKVVKVGKTYLDFSQWVEHSDGRQLVSATVRVACVNMSNGKPRKLLDELLNCLN